jgi:hypothetical protein
LDSNSSSARCIFGLSIPRLPVAFSGFQSLVCPLHFRADE